MCSIAIATRMLPITLNICNSPISRLVHSYSDKKVSEQRITFVLLEVSWNIVTRPMWTAARIKDSGTKKSATTSHAPSSYGIKETWILTQVWVSVFGTLVQDIFSLLGFWIKSLFLTPVTHFLIYWIISSEKYILGLCNSLFYSFIYNYIDSEVA